MVEIRESLARSRTALFEAGGRAPEDQATQLQHAKSHLHQAHGALQMVDVEGVSQMTEVAEAALDRFKAGTLKCRPIMQAVAQLYQALVEYLEELLEGAPSQPAKLFPYYRAVQEMLGWSASIRPICSIPTVAAGQPAAGRCADAAPALDCRLPPALRARAAALPERHWRCGRAAGRRQAGGRCAAGRAGARLLARHAGLRRTGGRRQLPGGLYVKQLFGLINLQIRRLSQGEAAQPEAMLRDALFFVASRRAVGRHRCSSAQGFALDGLAPADYRNAPLRPGRHEALERAKAGIAQAKAYWDRWQRRNRSGSGCRFDALARRGRECDKLNLSALGALLRQLADVARKAYRQAAAKSWRWKWRPPCCLRNTACSTSVICPVISRRMPTPSARACWRWCPANTGAGAMAKGLARQMQQDDTVVALAMELKTGLRQVEGAGRLLRRSIQTSGLAGTGSGAASAAGRWRCWTRTMRCTRRAM
jgi:chemosensory pili system protein ChpA (sensor histidine kinase/response regulator)